MPEVGAFLIGETKCGTANCVMTSVCWNLTITPICSIRVDISPLMVYIGSVDKRGSHMDIAALEALTWKYSNMLGEVIHPILWEQILTASYGGVWIQGDKFMVDGRTSNCGLNIKTHKGMVKTPKQRVKLVQCRCPIENETDLTDEQIGEQAIRTLVEKRDSALSEFELDEIIDVTLLHQIKDGYYHVRVYVESHPDYASYDLEWQGGVASKNGKKILSRVAGNASAFQTCLHVHKDLSIETLVADFSVPFSTTVIDVDAAKREYSKHSN